MTRQITNGSRNHHSYFRISQCLLVHRVTIPLHPTVIPLTDWFFIDLIITNDFSIRLGILVGLGCIFLAGLIALAIYLCKTHRRSKRRQYLHDDEQLLIFPVPKPMTAVPRPALRNSSSPVRNVGVTAPTAHVSTPVYHWFCTSVRIKKFYIIPDIVSINYFHLATGLGFNNTLCAFNCWHIIGLLVHFRCH